MTTSLVTGRYYVVVRVGALDDRASGRPDSTTWCASVPSWGLIDPAVPAADHHVPMPIKP